MQIDVYEPAQPPPHLSPSARHWWQTTVDRFELQEHHLRLLRLCLEAWDLGQAARERVAKEGLTVSGAQGVKPHPCIAIERDARQAVARLVRELDLDTSPPVPERNGPAGLFSNRRPRGGRHAGQGTDT